LNASGFYDRHPISAQRVLAAVAGRRGFAAGRLSPDDLYDFDQDHYGGVAATDVLARRAGIVAGMRVLDVCAGLAGPARFLATARRCRVVGVDLHAARCAGAVRLTAAVGLADRVRVVRADATVLPFAAGSFDACISQEGLLHVADKGRALHECRRVLVAGGRLAFTDWIATARLGDGERRRLAEWTAATTLQTLDGYRALLRRAAFAAVEAEDITDEWRPVLKSRFERYRALGARAADALGVYAYFVGLVEAGKVGGGRFSGTASAGP
jgi:ubiquinone/menaquinone biosynthesis C-methylase UbiE